MISSNSNTNSSRSEKGGLKSLSQGKKVDEDEDNNKNKVELGGGGSSSSSRQWSGFRNPRIVRVSRSFGGKDRHSKVCTVRGLRDRRIRLSVPTAIHLYDLQDRLGLSQPSKVIDWLIDNTKNDIDKLPPLKMPPGFGGHHHPHHMLFPLHQELPMLIPSSSSSIMFGEDQTYKNYWDLDAAAALLRGKSKQVVVEQPSSSGHHHHRFFPPATASASSNNESNSSSLHEHPPAAANFSSNNGNNVFPFNAYYQWDPSSLSLSSQFGNINNNQAVGFVSSKPTLFPAPSYVNTNPIPIPIPIPMETNHHHDLRQMMMKPVPAFSLDVNPPHSPNHHNRYHHRNNNSDDDKDHDHE